MWSYLDEYYYYIKNQQGDILGFTDSEGTVVVTYEYDAWGNLISYTGTSYLAEYNSLRYRSYAYDNETGLYYLQSRYYDPKVGRFLNADDTDYLGASGTVLGYNLYAYCENNPCVYYDSSGCLSSEFFWNYVNSLPLVGGIRTLAGFSWDSKQGIWYSNMYSIQRCFGYCDMYDSLAPVAGIFIKHKKMSFNFEGKNWMIWIWKGQYGITTGAEIGLYVYSRTFTAKVLGKKYSQKWYRCAYDSERIYMAFTLYKNGKKVFSRAYQKHWWLTGFKPGMFSSCNNLSMYITLGFKNSEMARAFCTSNGLPETNSNKVSFWW